MNWSMVWEEMVCPVIEIGILATLIYAVLYFLRGLRGVFVLSGVLIVLGGLSLLAEWLEFQVIGRLTRESGVVAVVAIIVIFQPELRRAFALADRLFRRDKRQQEVIGEIVTAVIDMARRKCGALIVLERRIGMRALEEEAVRLDIKVNALVLESIFYPNSPMHDGAVIIRDDRIVAARVILPLTRNENPDVKQLGTRHRAAVGISEETDAVAVVVSEETGIISICVGGELKRDLPPTQIEEELNKRMLNSRQGSASLLMLPVDDSRDPHHTEDLR